MIVTRKRFWLALLLAPCTPAAAAPTHTQTHLSFVMEADPSKALAEVVVEGMRTVYISGPIADGDTRRFLEFVRLRNLEAAKLVFDSPGGSLLEGVKLGQAIRRLRFFTTVGAKGDSYRGSHAVCASACAYAFAGGASRFLGEGSGRLGIHQFRSAKGISEGEAQLVSGMLVSYLREMGVDPEAFAVASATNPDGITWLTPKEAEALGFVNNGVLPTTAEIKVVQMHPYLRLNQEQYNVTIRVLFLCDNKSLSMQAGIVSNPQQSSNIADPTWQKRSYVEMDGKEQFEVNGADGAKANESTIWLMRTITPQDTENLASTNELGVWVDGFGAVRWGGTIDLTKVHAAMENYFDQCFD